MTATPRPFPPFESFPPAELLTPRLRLRALKPTDGELLFKLYASDPETCRYMSFQVTGKVEDTQAYVEGAIAFSQGKQSPIRHVAWVIERKESGEAVGSVGIGPSGPFSVSGGFILNRRCWAQGIATEAWKRVIEWAKTQQNIYRIEAVHCVENSASGRVMERAGMMREGVLRRHSVFPNVGPLPRDVVMYAWVRAL
jgi:RimJ/RimL family protein N-acetyltransferase